MRIKHPEFWIKRFACLFPKDSQILDLACGGGRHSKLLLDLGHHVTAVDLHTSIISERLGECENISIVTADLENGPGVFTQEGALWNRQFDGIVGVNYLHRDLFPSLVEALRPGGVFLYETFAVGNEHYGRPRNPDHLLRSGELLEVAAGKLQIIAYEHGVVNADGGPGVRQRIAAIKSDRPQKLEDVNLSDYS